MRALFVVRTAEASEARLLGPLVVLRWPGGDDFEGPVHALVRPVRLRAPRCNTLMTEAECDSPRGELAQAAEGRGDERRAIVRANGFGQAILVEQALEAGACFHLLRREPRRAGEEKAAVGVGHRQGGAVEAIAGAELAFEVRRPDGLRGLGLEGDGPRMPVPTAACARLTEAFAVEQFAGGARRWQGAVRPAACEEGQDLARTPVSVSLLGCHQDGFDLLCHAVGAAVRGPTLLLEPRRSWLGIAAYPTCRRCCGECRSARTTRS